jgi:hypothetical protein
VTDVAPAPALELERLLGAWYLLFSNRSEWRSRAHARIEHLALAQVDGRPALRSTLRFSAVDLFGRAKHRVTPLLAVSEAELPGRFEIRGSALARLSHARYCVAAVDPGYRWALVWHDRTRLGHSPGLDIHTRAPALDPSELDRILAAIAEHPGLASRAAGLFATTQHWSPVSPYRLP